MKHIMFKEHFNNYYKILLSTAVVGHVFITIFNSLFHQHQTECIFS